jgi:hypothetical protein
VIKRSLELLEVADWGEFFEMANLRDVQLSRTTLTLFWYAAGFNPSPRAGEGL